MILSGIKVRDAHLSQLKKDVAECKRAPSLAIVQVGARTDSTAYVDQKKKWGDEVGIVISHIQFPEDVDLEEVRGKIKELNTDSSVDGIIVQLPLPDGFNSEAVIGTIAPEKDVDGLTDESQTKLLNADLSGFIPATAKGVNSILEYYNINVSGKKVVVIGRSRLVGGPTAALMKAKGAEVEVCHSKTENTADIARTAEVLITATGVIGLVTKEFVKEGATVIDVGINLVSGDSLNEEIPTKKFVGDVAFDEVKDIAGNITPVPGGVGPMTVVSLLENVLQAYTSSN